MADESEKPKVKCSECGMLALKESSATTLASLAIEPPEEKMRKSKVVNLINSGFDDRPYCCINAQRIHEKYDELVLNQA